MVHISLPNASKELISSLSIPFTETSEGLLVDYAHLRPHLTNEKTELTELVKTLNFDSFVFSEVANATERVN